MNNIHDLQLVMMLIVYEYSLFRPCWCIKTWTAVAAFTKNGLTLIPAWISNYIHYNVWDEITYPFLNFNGATVEV